MKTTLVFNLEKTEHVTAFIRSIRELNESGVPYEVEQFEGEIMVNLHIGEGY